MTYEQKKKRILKKKQLEMTQSLLDHVEMTICNADHYEDREYILGLLFDEMKEYFGDKQ